MLKNGNVSYPSDVWCRSRQKRRVKRTTMTLTSYWQDDSIKWSAENILKIIFNDFAPCAHAPHHNKLLILCKFQTFIHRKLIFCVSFRSSLLTQSPILFSLMSPSSTYTQGMHSHTKKRCCLPCWVRKMHNSNPVVLRTRQRLEKTHNSKLQYYNGIYIFSLISFDPFAVSCRRVWHSECCWKYVHCVRRK